MPVAIKLGECPRCNGAVMDYKSPIADSPMCITCGWRKELVPQDVLDEVEAHLGKAFMEDRYTHRQIGTGKAPLSGWEREKRRRQRESDTKPEKLAG